MLMENLLTNATFAPIREVAVVRSISSGEVIFVQGEPPAFVGVIVQGAAAALARSRGGEETWLDYYSRGDLLSHAVFLTQGTLQVEVVAETDLTMLTWTTSQLNTLLEEQTNLAADFLPYIAHRVEQLSQRLLEAYTLSARERVQLELSRLATPIGKNPETSIIRPNPVLSRLARRVNSTRETASRTISDLLKKGILSREPGALIVVDPAALQSSGD